MLTLAILLAAFSTASLVLASPYALNLLRQNTNIDWTQLSGIGATYGAVSAILAAIALIGVTASLIIQARQAKAARKNALRGLHADLMRMAMDEPLYMECWGAYLTKDFDGERQFAYINLIVSYWHSVFDIHEMNDDRLRASAASLFEGQPGRDYWRHGRDFWRDSYHGRRARKFHQIIDQAYRDSLDEPPFRPPTPTDSALASRAGTGEPPLPRTGVRGRIAIGLTGVALALVSLLIRRLIDHLRSCGPRPRGGR